MKNYKIEFLTQDELVLINSIHGFTPRQVKIIDVLKSWSLTRADKDGWFTLSTIQIANELGVSKSSIDRDLVIIKAQEIVENKTVKMTHCVKLVNAYKLTICNENDTLCQKNDTMKMTHSISNSNSNKNKILTTNYNTTKTMGTAITLNNTLKYYSSNFEITYNFNSIDELFELLGRLKDFDKSVEDKKEEEVVASVATPASASEKKMNLPTKTLEKNVSASTEFGSLLGEFWTRVDERIKEVNALQLSSGSELHLVGGNKYDKFKTECMEWFNANTNKMSSKQRELTNNKIERLASTIATKLENIHKYNGKTKEEVAKIKSQSKTEEAFKNLKTLCDKMALIDSREEWLEKHDKLEVWVNSLISTGVIDLQDREQYEVFNKLLGDAYNSAKKNIEDKAQEGAQNDVEVQVTTSTTGSAGRAISRANTSNNPITIKGDASIDDDLRYQPELSTAQIAQQKYEDELIESLAMNDDCYVVSIPNGTYTGEVEDFAF